MHVVHSVGPDLREGQPTREQVLALLATQPKVRLAAPVVSAALLVNFVGGGLEGSVSSSDYNLALDDGVKGCPAYEQVRQPSMDGFDITK